MANGWNTKEMSGYKVPWHEKVKDSGKSTIKPVNSGWAGRATKQSTAGGPGATHKGVLGGKD